MPTVLCILLIFTSMYMKNQIYVLIPNVLNLMHSRPLQGHSYSLILRKDKKSPPPPDLGKIFCLAGESLQQIQLHPAGKLGGKLFRIFGREGNYLGYLVLWETI